MKIENKLIEILREIVFKDVYDNYGSGSVYWEARELLKRYDEESK